MEYFVFTDDQNIVETEDVHIIHKESRGFPYDTLFRFDMFLSIEKELEAFDYAFFFNSNMVFVDHIGLDLIPKEEGLAAVIHPGYYNKPAFRIPYERRKKSTAYIPPYQGNYHYYMGSLNGGKVASYMALARTCAENIHKDFDKGIIAIFHDESHMNWYIHHHKCKGLHPSYAYPENSKLPFKPKIIIKEKSKYDKYFDISKGRSYTFTGLLKKSCHVLWHSIRWYFYI